MTLQLNERTHSLPRVGGVEARVLAILLDKLCDLGSGAGLLRLVCTDARVDVMGDGFEFLLVYFCV